jgi:hypothetical protein
MLTVASEQMMVAMQSECIEGQDLSVDYKKKTSILLYVWSKNAMNISSH